MFCKNCGRELQDGEVCSCAQNSGEQASASSLPDGKAIIEGAKKTAEALKNNPIVSEVWVAVKGSAADPEKQVRDNLERTDILWAVMAAVEAVLISLGLAIYINKALSAVLKAVSSGFVSIKVGAGSFFKIFGAAFLWSAISIFAIILIYMLFMKICQKQTGFCTAANAVATAIMPSALIVFAAGILSLIYLPLGSVLIAASVFSLVVLCYGMVRDINGLKIPTFWMYIIFAAVSAAVCTLAGNLCMRLFVESMTESLMNRLF